MLQNHLNLLEKTIETHDLIPPGAKILVAISGGPDSVYMAFLLYTLGFKISLAHVNYGLRNLDSENDEALVKSYSKRWKVPIYIHKENPNSRMLDFGESLQQSARFIRYQFFEGLIKSQSYDNCALAHHADDQAESILISLIKGNSDRVLHGMPIKRGPFIRPLIDFRKKDILAGLEEAGLNFGHDISNDGNDYLRNKIRNQVIPLLSELNPSITQQLLDRERLYQAQKDQLDAEMEALYLQMLDEYPDGTKTLYWELPGEPLSSEKLTHLLTYAFRKWGWHGNDLWNAVDLLDKMPGRMTKGALGNIYKERMGISFIPDTKEPQSWEATLKEVPQTKLRLNSGAWLLDIEQVKQAHFGDPSVFYLDIDSLSFPLRLRKPQQGERMKPLGMDRRKKLSDIMIDAKWSHYDKQVALILEDQNRIVALVGFRISESVKLSPQSTNILKVSFTREV